MASLSVTFTVMGSQKEKRETEGHKNLLEETRAESFPNLGGKAISIQLQEAQAKPRRCTPRHTTVKM